MTTGTQWTIAAATSPKAAEARAPSVPAGASPGDAPTSKPDAPKAVKLRIVYNKKGCIGSGHCVLSDPYNFILDGEFHANLKEGKPMGGLNSGVFVRETETDSPHLAINAAHTCTPRVIAVFQQVEENGKSGWRRID